MSRPRAPLRALRPLSVLLPRLLALAVPGLAGPAVRAVPAVPAGPAEEPPVGDRPLIGAWSFDEPAGGACRDSSGRGHHAAPEGGDAPGVGRTTGVFGDALDLRGRHAVAIPGGPALEDTARIALSVWVLPLELGGYRELFRKEDGERRVLFSFQHDGTLLSLGLNVGGYVECDARVDPALLLDGAWHHCAATFDGQHLRVYLDGREVGALRRPGRISAGGGAPGCIGSTDGGECFQGAQDELRIYADALSAEEVAALHRGGVQALVDSAPALELELAEAYAPAATFARTLAATRARLREGDAHGSARLAAALLARLRADFPGDYADFVRWTGASPRRYLLAPDGAYIERAAGRLVELLFEYRPLTAEQRRRQTPADRRRWEELEPIRLRHLELLAREGDTSCAPEWVALVLAAGPQVRFRPSVAEAVAPYVPPATPPTRDRSPAEVRALLERDWLHQAGPQPGPERVRDELRWARALARRITGAHPGAVDLTSELRALADLEREAAAAPAFDAELYLRVRQVKRAIAFANPVVDFDRVLFVDVPLPQGSEWPHETRHRLGYMAVPGGRLQVLTGLSPAGSLTQLMPQPPLHGSFWRPDLSFDGRRVVFCYKPHNEPAFHLYEIGVDGSGLRQLTDGPYDDLDPIYLPDGEHLLFSTTRAHTYVRCMPPTNAYVLARCAVDGSDIYLVSRNNEPDYLPSVLDDGRVVYTRWEYTDKPLWRAQGLWTAHPDGTQVRTLWGNQSVWPDLMKDARGIPGSRRVMFTGSAHHDWFSGSVGIVDPAAGSNFPHGLTKVTADLPWPECGDGPLDPVESPDYHASGDYAAYYSPYPLGERDFLVSANRGGKFVLYLMDVDGNRELVVEGEHHVLHALPVRPRPVPPALPDVVAWPSAEERERPADGVIYSADVYQGAPPELSGRARFLRVLAMDAKTYTYWHQRPYISTGPVVSLVQSEGVKRVLGTVPIEADGSVSFHAPAGKPLHFQLLDGQYQALHTMRSFTGVMPGEYRGCLGCHASHSRAPRGEGTALALGRPPRAITPPPWGDDTVSYLRYAKPVLERYCGDCHQGQGAGREAFDLTPSPGFLGFEQPYVTLTGMPSWGAPYRAPERPSPGWGFADVLMVEAYDTRDPRAYATPAPMTGLSSTSRLIRLASSGEHHGVVVDPLSLRRLIVWVDTLCPYRGDEEVRAIPDPDFQGVDWLSVRPRIESAPRVTRPGPLR